MTWIFAYGSLMWDADFEPEESVKAVLTGYYRDFNKRSVEGWGTSDNPGPVLGLKEGGECTGIAFRLNEDLVDDIVTHIDEDREGPSYDMQDETVTLADGRKETAIVWNNKRNHTYIGDRSLDERARMVVSAVGNNGPAKLYVRETRDTLREMDVRDPAVEDMADRVKTIEQGE